MSAVSIPYQPGYSDAIRAWATYFWKRHRRALVWFLVFVGVDLLLIASGFRNWRLWVSTATLGLTAAVALVPLAFRILWAYKIRQLGIHELEVSEIGIVLHGTGLRVQSPFEAYAAFSRPTGTSSSPGRMACSRSSPNEGSRQTPSIESGRFSKSVSPLDARELLAPTRFPREPGDRGIRTSGCRSLVLGAPTTEWDEEAPYGPC